MIICCEGGMITMIMIMMIIIVMDVVWVNLG